jgi:predicted house-cleaning noncanonical NTP pyrophosphatase (MazG superfamily)
MIKNRADLWAARYLENGKFILTISPNVELIRDDTFLRDLSIVAKEVAAPVELHGSVLGHAYYMLQRQDVTVIASGETSYSRVRGRQVFEKLVRDQVPDEIERHGETLVLAQIPKQDARAALVVKLFEEAQEVLRATTPDEVEAELADLLEVVLSLASATGISWQDVENAANKKRARRGSFDTGTVLIETAWPKNAERNATEPKVMRLKALAKTREDPSGSEINFAALVAPDANRILTTRDGTTYIVTLTGFGVRLTPLDADLGGSTQLDLPGLKQK